MTLVNAKPKKVLILGSGALKIGEAGEFDYSGSQAIKALKEEKIETVLVNPNIATVQTSEGMADHVYFLPVNPFFVEKVIAKEKVDAILLGFGGQTALNCGLALHESGALRKYHVAVLGTPIEAIKNTEDRALFNNVTRGAGFKVPEGYAARTVREALAIVKKVKMKFPLLVRAGYALGGKGSGVARDSAALKHIVSRALCSVPQVLIEEYLGGWKEIEYEIMRDKFDNCITICNMENLDPMGIHTGESMVVAPSQTLTNNEYHALRSIAFTLIRRLGIVGECNIQFALDRGSSDYRIIEVNARLSRSSALASKATGYPIAFVAAKLALGYRLTEIKNSVTRVTTACFEPALDYIALKIPRWDFKKFRNMEPRLGSQMQSVGEVMALGRTFEETLQKAVRMLDIGAIGFMGTFARFKNLKRAIKEPTDERLFAIAEALSREWSPRSISRLSGIDCWFIEKMKRIIDMEIRLRNGKCRISKQLLKDAKNAGFSDAYIALCAGKSEQYVRNMRKEYAMAPSVKQIDTLAGEFFAKTNYLYTTYSGERHDVSFRKKTGEKKIMVLGSGTYRIGSSVEFDWCTVHAVRTLHRLGYTTTVINCNPETVSTDYDESDHLYFEELTLERVLDIYEIERPLGVMISVGGQIPNNLAQGLAHAGVHILGTSADAIDKAENRHTFSELVETLGLGQPEWKEMKTIDEMKKFARNIGFPVLVRPSYVLSGTAMGIAFNERELVRYVKRATTVNRKHPVVVTKFIVGAKELEMDAVAQDGKIIAYAISEHVENAGVHSGDATIVFPSRKIHEYTKNQIINASKKIARTLHINGPFNIQFLAKDDALLIIECNLRASRTFPFISKVLKKNFIETAVTAMLRLRKKQKMVREPHINFVGVKVPQFSFSRLIDADPILTVDMRSTGEVAAFGETIEEAFLKSLIATGFTPPKKNILLSLGGDRNKADFIEYAHTLASLGFILYATRRTAEFFKRHRIYMAVLNKPTTGKEPLVQTYLERKKIDCCINTSDVEFSEHIHDDYLMRRAAIDCNIPLITNIEVAKLFVRAIEQFDASRLQIKSWEEY